MGDFAVRFPWPFHNRCMHLAVSAMPARTERAIVVTMKSIKGEKWLGKYEVERDPQLVEIEFEYSSAFVEILDDNKQRLRFMFRADPQMTTLPQWFINQGMKAVALVFLTMIGRMA